MGWVAKGHEKLGARGGAGNVSHLDFGSRFMNTYTSQNSTNCTL